MLETRLDLSEPFVRQWRRETSRAWYFLFHALARLQIIDMLLDVNNMQHKPQYIMASEVPLVLYDCQFDGVDWMIDSGMFLLGIARTCMRCAALLLH